MGSAAELVVLVKETINTQRLIRLTNESGTATSVDDTFLANICNRVLGRFRQITGLEPDTTTPIYAHVEALEEGVLWLLENKKGREAGMTDEHRKSFYSQCKLIRETLNSAPQSNSNFRAVNYPVNSIQDMDRNRIVFRGRVPSRNYNFEENI